MDDSRIARMKELVGILNRAGRAYYVENQEIMSNLEYDRLYDELLSLEKETGTVLSSSPTQHVGYEAVDRLPKERHEKPMLSLDKTKDREALRTFIGSRKTLVSWKLDGLTVVLTYENGSLAKAVTRGNGIIGEVITPNARVFEKIPQGGTDPSGRSGHILPGFQENQRIVRRRQPVQKSAESLQRVRQAAGQQNHSKTACPALCIRSCQSRWGGFS